MPLPATSTLPGLVAACVILVLLLPLVRFRLRSGFWAVVVRASGGPVERFVRAWTAGLLGLIVLWAVLVRALDPAALGIWSLPPLLPWLGLALAAAALALVVVAQAQMGPSWRIGIDDAPTALVTGGLYARVRHPIYTGVLTLLVALWCLTPSAWTLSGVVLAHVLIGVQCRLEEAHMHDQHGESFARWAARTGRVVPWVGRWRPPATGAP